MFVPRQLGRFISALLFLGAVASQPAEGASVKSIQPDGKIELEDGTQVVLAGITLSQEAYTLLPALLVDQDVEMKYDGVTEKWAYLFVKLREMSMPFKADESPRQRKVMINEWLLELGAARVNTAETFDLEKEFMVLQEKAKQEGKGIWSYEIK